MLFSFHYKPVQKQTQDGLYLIKATLNQDHIQVVLTNLHTDDRYLFHIVHQYHFSLYRQMISGNYYFENIAFETFTQNMRNKAKISIKTKHQNIAYITDDFRKGNTVQKLKNLTEASQMALMAYQIIDFIINIDRKTFYQKSTNSIGQRIVDLLHDKFEGKLSQQSLYQMTDFFIFPGVAYNKSIFNQDRFMNGSSNEKLTYFPTFVTQQIFKLILSSNLNVRSLLIFGQSGIGKSFAFSLFSMLAYIIERCIMKKQLQSIHNFVPLQLMKAVPKILYFSINKYSSEEQFKESILSQLPQEIRNQMKSESRQTKVGVLIGNINKYYGMHNIKVVYLIDQINVFYSLIRQQKVQKAQSIKQFITAIGNINRIIFSSSNTSQIQVPYQVPYYKKDQTCNILNVTCTHQSINRKQYAAQPQGFYQLLNIIQFQIKKSFSNLSAQNLKIYQDNKKKQFDTILKNNLLQKSIKQNKFSYSSDITPLNVSLYYYNIETLKQIILKENGEQGGFDTTQYYLGQLIEDIQMFSGQSIINQLKNYLQKGNEATKNQRLLLHLKIYDYLRKYPQIQEFPKKTWQIQFRHIIKGHQEEKSLIENLNKNLFGYDSYKKVIIFYCLPNQMEYILGSALFINNNPIEPIFNHLLKEYFQSNAGAQGEFLDKIFARVVSQCQFNLVFDRKISYTIKNLTGKGKYFYHLKNYQQVDIKNKKGQDIGEQYMRTYFDLLFNDPDLEYQRYLGAAPKKISDYRDKQSKILLTNSPSIDFLLIRKVKNKQLTYEIRTFDLTVAKLTKSKTIEEKIEKAKNVMDFIKRMSQKDKKNAQIKVNLVHTIIGSSNEIKDAEQYIKKYEVDPSKISFSLLEQMQILHLNQKNKFKSSFLHLSSVLSFVKSQLRKNK